MNKEPCRRLYWTPQRGGPLDFAKFAIETSPYTKRRGFSVKRIFPTWWESQQDWLLERILRHPDVVHGYCFGEPVDLDRLCMDIWHRHSPEPERPGPERVA